MVAFKELKDVQAELKKIPGFTTGVRTNSQVRTVTLAQPICPFSAIEMERDYKGDWVPKKGPTDPNRQNCQRGGGRWWDDCVKRGHNADLPGVPEGLGPWFRQVVWYVTTDDFDEVTGEMVGTKRYRRSMVMPNLKQVPISLRLDSGQKARRAIQRKGCKRLNEVGYEEVCQYRNCQNPVNPECCSREYGDYCCNEELALVAADGLNMALIRPSAELQGVDERKFVRAREKQLSEALATAKE